MGEYLLSAAPLAIILYWLISGRLMVNPNAPRFTLLTPVKRWWAWVKFRRYRKRVADDLQQIIRDSA